MRGDFGLNGSGSVDGAVNCCVDSDETQSLKGGRELGKGGMNSRNEESEEAVLAPVLAELPVNKSLFKKKIDRASAIKKNSEWDFNEEFTKVLETCIAKGYDFNFKDKSFTEVIAAEDSGAKKGKIDDVEWLWVLTFMVRKRK
ncbi:hypothetical protein LWI28_017377 [Acer negundo]|uniref:Uncharacterized protein n=1 Tax=Acer negundo TaxID=4023 RepID=A0AAD5IFR6_ACENE|nr:hypothetical protein LWI28_017377 [Acer negundo]